MTVRRELEPVGSPPRSAVHGPGSSSRETRLTRRVLAPRVLSGVTFSKSMERLGQTTPYSVAPTILARQYSARAPTTHYDTHIRDIHEATMHDAREAKSSQGCANTPTHNRSQQVTDESTVNARRERNSSTPDAVRAPFALARTNAPHATSPHSARAPPQRLTRSTHARRAGLSCAHRVWHRRGPCCR